MAELAQEWISILPDASKLAAGINAAVTKAKVKPLVIPVKFETKQLNEAIQKLKPKAIKLPVAIDRTSLNKSITDVSKTKLKPLKLEIQVDKTAVNRGIAEAEKTKPKAIKVPVELQTPVTPLTSALKGTAQTAGQQYGQSMLTGVNQAIASSPVAQAAGTTAGKKAAAGVAAGVASGASQTQSSFAKMFNISSHVSRMQSSLQNATSSWNTMSQAADKTHGRMVGAIQQMIRYSLIFTAGGAIFGGMKYLVTTGMEFDDTLHLLGATTKANNDQMTAMSDTARALGRDMSLPATSANDAAAAMLAMTQAGFNVDQAMSAARGSLQLATATNIEASDSGKIVATTLNSFHRPAEDATKAVDLLTNVFLKSGAPINDIALAFQQAATVGGIFGLSMEDTAATMALLAKNGIRGSDAGTLLKTMLAGLTDQGKPAQEAIHELGLTVNDANGNFVGMQSIMEQLNAARGRMTQADYAGASATLFGTDAIRIAGVAATGTADAWKEMRDAVVEQGTAQRVAESRMQGLPGAVEKVKNSFEGLSLAIYDMVKGPLTTIATGVAEGLSGFTEWITGSSTSLKVFGGVLEYVAITVGLCAVAFGAWKIATLAQTAAMWLLDAALNANPISLIIIAIAAVIAALVLLYQHNEGFRNFVNALWEGIKVAFDKIMVAVHWLVEQWNAAWPTIKTVLETVWNVIKTIFTAIGETCTWLWQNIIVPAFEGISNAISVAWDIIKLPFQLFEAAMRVLGPIAMALWDVYIQPAWEFIKNAISAAWDFMSPIFDTIGAAFSKLGDVAKAGFNAFGDVAKTVGSAVKDVWDGLWNILKIPLHGLGNFLVGIPDTVLGVKIDFISDVHDWGKTLQGLRTGGILRGPGTGTSDSILATNSSGVPTARVSNGEGVVPAAPLKTPMGMALFNTLLGMAGGGRLPTGAIIWPPQPVGPVDKTRPGGVPDLTGHLPGPHLPDWSGTFGPPDAGWWDRPINPDDILFPELQPPWMQDWLKKHPPKGWKGKRIEGYRTGGFMQVPYASTFMKSVRGFAGGGVVTDEEKSRLGGGTVNQSILEAIRETNPRAVLTSGYTDHAMDGGYHPKKKAIDIDPSDANLRAAWAMRDDLVMIIHDDPKYVWYNVGGQRAEGAAARAIYGEATMRDHGNHIHLAAEHAVGPVSGGVRGAAGPDISELTSSSSPDEVAAAIIAEAQKRGFSKEETIAILSTALQESGLDPKAVGGGGAWKGIFQQDKSYPQRESPAGQVGGFFERLGGPGGDIWEKIFTLQQGKSSTSPGARTGYMGEIQSQKGRAEGLYASAATSSYTNAGGHYEVDEKKVREAEEKVTDTQNRLDVANQRLKEYTDKRAAGEKVKDSTIQAAQDQVDKLTREVQDAKDDLETAKQGKFVKDKGDKAESGAKSTGKKQGADLDTKSLGKMFVEGMFETIGLDGSVLDNPFEWPSVKSGMALFNYGMGLAKFAGTDWVDENGNPKQGPDNPWTGQAQGGAGGTGAPGGGDMGIGALTGIGDVLGVQFPEEQKHQGTGNEPGPGVDNSMNVNIENAGMTQEQVAASVTEPQRQQARRYTPPNDGG
jgi:TP901 family phage tail tape measure protein